MPIYCPHCATPYDIRAPLGPAGRMARCERCGTTWLARLIADDPYRRRQAPALAAPADVSDALVIEHVGAGFKPPPPPPPRQPKPAASPRDRGAVKLIAAALAVVVAIILMRVPFVAALPEVPGLADAAASLTFAQVTSQTVSVHGVDTVIVEGEIVNRSGHDVALPAVRVALRSADGAEVQSWLVEPAADGLAAGQSIGFRSAVASPSPAATQVTLKLAARQGDTIGLR